MPSASIDLIYIDPLFNTDYGGSNDIARIPCITPGRGAHGEDAPSVLKPCGFLVLRSRLMGARLQVPATRVRGGQSPPLSWFVPRAGHAPPCRACTTQSPRRTASPECYRRHWCPSPTQPHRYSKTGPVDSGAATGPVRESICDVQAGLTKMTIAPHTRGNPLYAGGRHAPAVCSYRTLPGPNSGTVTMWGRQHRRLRGHSRFVQSIRAVGKW